jgi:hypothetical protein
MVKRLLPYMCVCGLVMALGPSKAAAQQTKKPPSPWAAQIIELHQVKDLLNLADRDYKGHRAAAVKEITAAIHALQMGYAHPKLPKSSSKGGGEAQSLSDAQLNEAITQLQTIQTQLTKGTTQGAAVVTANAALDTAVSELKIALTIK